MKTLNACKLGLALTAATFVGLATSQPANALSYSLTDLSALGVPAPNSYGNVYLNDLGQVVSSYTVTEGQRKAVFWDKNTGAIDIGTPGVNYNYFFLNDFNNLGQVIGSAGTVDGQSIDFVWDKNTGLLDIGSLTGAGGTFTELRDINNLGQVVGSYFSNGQDRAFLWDKNTGISDLGTLGGNSVAYAINDLGQVVGDYGQYTDENGFVSGFSSPFIWDKTNGISQLSGDGLSQLIEQGYKNLLATDINNSGQVLVEAYNPEIDESGIGVYWDKDSGFISTGIGVVEDAYVLGINDLGQIVGSGFNDNRFGGYIWQKNTATINLDFFPSGFNNLGQVVGQSREKTYLRDQNNGLVDLDQVVSSFGWSIELNDREDGRGNLLINDAGQIFGTGFFNGERRAFLLTPDSSPSKSVPEPATALGVLAFGAFAAAFGAKRQQHKQF